jgi:hypothetical protein
MTILREAMSSNHIVRPKVLLGMAVMFILVLGVFVTMFLVAAISVG